MSFLFEILSGLFFLISSFLTYVIKVSRKDNKAQVSEIRVLNEKLLEQSKENLETFLSIMKENLGTLTDLGNIINTLSKTALDNVGRIEDIKMKIQEQAATIKTAIDTLTRIESKVNK